MRTPPEPIRTEEGGGMAVWPLIVVPLLILALLTVAFYSSGVRLF